MVGDASFQASIGSFSFSARRSLDIAAMPATLDGLLARKFQFVTVSQLIAMESTGVADNTTPPAVAGEGAVTADPVPEVKPLPSADPAAGTADVE